LLEKTTTPCRLIISFILKTGSNFLIPQAFAFALIATTQPSLGLETMTALL